MNAIWFKIFMIERIGNNWFDFVVHIVYIGIDI